MLSDINQWTH
jgi:hypothetical protein